MGDDTTGSPADPGGAGGPDVRRRPGRRRTWIALVGAACLAVVAVAAAMARPGSSPLAATPPPTAAPTTTLAPTTTSTEPTGPVCTPVPEGTGPPGPLTGLPVESPGAEQRPALIVKIDNYDPNARPQAGLTRADVVFEEKVEGPLSRFAAVFQSTASDAGPVRSARTTDVSIAAMLGTPLFAYSGANPSFQSIVSRAPLVDVGAGARGGAYRRSGDRAAPHNLFVSTPALWSGAGVPPPGPLWAFRSADVPAPAGQPVNEASYHFGGGVIAVRWTWDPETGTFQRWQNGTPHIDTDWCQVQVANVIVQLVDYVGSGVADSSGGDIPEAVLIGSGDAWVLSGGQAVQATWRRDDPTRATEFIGADGQALAMAPGRTWVALVPRRNGVVLG